MDLNLKKKVMSYTKNEIALEMISNINNQFYYIGEDDDKVAPIDVKKFIHIVHLLIIMDANLVE